ncbi:Branched-chain-amino-acid aminotransferase [Rubripirellula obstinata]|uniref:Branched-chain-amino-acid aminotransferase n=1 Tax=Rubripirellula obstinata TaxID=406547 RepID=A0A5B1CKB8_9BACT|nr:aminotransferase class IV [Rubripirellula obstinata]KAA1261498.1 Branched-chain-amino-acid aminotransferase [Rubripirellula obstinata]
MNSSPTDSKPDRHGFASHLCYFQSGDHTAGWMPRDQVRLSIDDVGFRQGVTAVERLRTYDGDVFCIDLHLSRWNQTLADLQINLDASNLVADLLDTLVVKNRLLIQSQGDVGITLFATPGEKNAANPTLCLHLNPIDHAMVDRKQHQGQAVVVTDIQQPPNQCWPRTAKVRSRIHYYLADHLARQQDSSAIGLLIDGDGSVTETSVANIAIVESGCIVSPEPTQILAGITQSVAMEIAAEASIGWTQARITPDRLRAADEVLLMGTDTGIWFANQVDGNTINRGKRGPVCEDLQRLFLKATRANPSIDLE